MWFGEEVIGDTKTTSVLRGLQVVLLAHKLQRWETGRWAKRKDC